MSIEQIKQLRTAIPVGLTEAKQLLEKFGSVKEAINSWNTQKEAIEQLERDRKYRNIDDDWVFSTEYCNNMEEDAKQFIKPLSKYYSRELWKTYVSETHKHMMLMQDKSDGKITNKVKQAYNWCKDWEEDNHDAFSDHIKPFFNWRSSDVVYFFWRRDAGVETQWQYLCKYWVAFMYEDEMNIVINPNSSKVLIMGVHGYVGLADRQI